MILKQIEEINKIRDSAQLVSKTLGLMAREIKPGVDSLYLLIIMQNPDLKVITTFPIHYV